MKNVRKLILSLVFVGLVLPTFAQEITEGIRPFSRKETANGLSMVIKGQTKNVDAVLSRKFKAATNQRGKAAKGLQSYENARMASISTSPMNIYYKVEKASRRDAQNSRVTIFLASSEIEFMSSESHPDAIAGAIEMMEGLQLDVNIYELELVLTEQNKVISKSIKEHEKMVKDSVNLENKLAETLQAIEENKSERANQLVKIDQEKTQLQEFEAKLQELKFGGTMPTIDPTEDEVIEIEVSAPRGGEKKEEGGEGGGGL